MKTISTPWTSGTHSSVRILVSNLKCIFSCPNSFSSNVDVDMNAACNSEIYEVFFLTSASADVFSLFPVLFFFPFLLRNVSWHLLGEWCVLAGGCVRTLSHHCALNVRIRSCTLSVSAWIQLGRAAQTDECFARPLVRCWHAPVRWER